MYFDKKLIKLIFGALGSQGGPMGSQGGFPWDPMGGDPWDPMGGTHGIPGWAHGTHWPLGTHGPLGTQALGDPWALGDPGPWGPMGPWARIFYMRVNTSISLPVLPPLPDSANQIEILSDSWQHLIYCHQPKG